MSVSNTNNVAQYTGDGATTTFGLTAAGNPIPYFAGADWSINLFDTVANADVSPPPALGGGGPYDYTITALSTDSFTGELTGNLVFNTAPLGNHRITATRLIAATSSNNFLDNSKFPAQAVNAQFDRLTMLVQQAIMAAGRALSRASSDVLGAPVVLPPDAQLRSMYLGFDAGGNPVALTAPASTTAVSGVMAAVIGAASLALAQSALFATQPLPVSLGGAGGGLTNTRLGKTGAYTVANGDKGKSIALGGGVFYSLGFGAPAGYDANFAALVVNEDTGRGKKISASGLADFILWPGQSCIVYNDNNVWKILPFSQRWAKSGAVFFVDPINGNDSNDGLASGTGAFLTIQHAVDTLHSSVDTLGGPPVINLADGTYSVGAGVNINYDLTGGAQFLITGNNASPGNVVVSCSPGGNCFNARDGGATVTLSGMTLSTTGNGAVFISATQDTVIDLCGAGPVNFNAAPLGNHVSVSTWAAVNFLGNYTINGSTTTHLTVAKTAYLNYGSITVTGAAGLAFTNFASVIDCGVLSAGGVAPTFSGFSGVTGTRYVAQQNGVIDSNASAATYPGNVAGSVASGGQAS